MSLGPDSVQPMAGAATTFPVNFSENALPPNSSWNLTLRGHTWNATASFLVLNEPNGTYSYTAASATFPGNFSANGSFTVAGQSLSVLVALRSPYAPAGVPSATSTSTALSPLSVLFLGGAAAAVLVVIAVVATAGRRARGELPPPPVHPTATGRPAVDPAPAKPPEGAEPDPLRHML